MTREEKQQIKELALQAGFKEKVQPDGSLDLNPYVYAFSFALMGRGMLRAASICFDRAEHLNNQRNDAETYCGQGAGILYRVSRDEADNCKALIRTAAAHLEQP